MNETLIKSTLLVTSSTTTVSMLAKQNVTTNPPENTEDHSKLTIAILGTLYSLIFFIGITGNSLVVYVVCVRKAMQSVTNLFIMNLALSDILMCLLAVPFTPISFFQDYWILGKFLCHLVPFSIGVSVYVSTLTSLAIAIDRYFVIVHPFKPRMKLGVCCLLIAVVWIVSISISLPSAIYIEFIPVNVNGQIKSKCRESWPIPMSRRFFNLASLVLQYLIPFTVITYSYTKIWIILSNRTRPGKTKEKEQLELRRKKRTNRMLIAMVIIFAGCWLPLNCVYLIMEFNNEFTKKPYFSNVIFISHVIAMSSTIYNPFLYAWLNDNFRKEFRLILPWIFKGLKWCSKSETDNNDEEENINNTNNNNNNNNFERTRFMRSTAMTVDDMEKNKTNSKLSGNKNLSLNNINNHSSTNLMLNSSKENKSLLKSSNKSKVIDESKRGDSDDNNNFKISREENNVTFDISIMKENLN